jgi:hypothetical protein
MWPFKKKYPPKQAMVLPQDWKDLLRTCDFLLAKRELQTYFDMATREAASEGHQVVYREEFVRGWQVFSQRPCFDTAVAFVEGAPEYACLLWPYFIECCPGGKWAVYDSLLGESVKDKNHK